MTYPSSMLLPSCSHLRVLVAMALSCLHSRPYGLVKHRQASVPYLTKLGSTIQLYHTTTDQKLPLWAWRLCMYHLIVWQCIGKLRRPQSAEPMQPSQQFHNVNDEHGPAGRCYQISYPITYPITDPMLSSDLFHWLAGSVPAQQPCIPLRMLTGAVLS